MTPIVVPIVGQVIPISQTLIQVLVIAATQEIQEIQVTVVTQVMQERHGRGWLDDC